MSNSSFHLENTKKTITQEKPLSNSKMKRLSLRKWGERQRSDSARQESTLEERDSPKEEQKARTDEARSRSNLVSCLSTCVANALLPPGSHVALVTAAAGADLSPVLQRACCSMFTRPAAQRGCCHRALQLRGGSEWVGHTTRAHGRLEAVRQLTLCRETK